jgi:hypothetical protein
VALLRIGLIAAPHYSLTMSFLILAVCLPFLACLSIFAYAVRCAPEGFEDETGFCLDEVLGRNVARHGWGFGHYPAFSH